MELNLSFSLEKCFTIYSASLLSRKPVRILSSFLWRKENETKKHPPPKPPYMGGVIDVGHKCLSIKVLAWLTQPLPFGLAKDFLKEIFR